ncbi:co-chaperone protein daf-41-like [Panonychus citri]|uniref:co-chaperone protein daf-41-like n=1 Tax=Panonychus citri TaxID=50023 RepID=UPI002307C31F|nr:co-chaperone protein daf-41-like [Panonychus citri]
MSQVATEGKVVGKGEESCFLSATTPPPVYWAQRKNLVYVRIALEDCVNPVIKVEKQSIYFKGKGGVDNKEYECDLKLFGEIKTEESKYSVRGRGIEFVLFKVDDKGPYWKRLSAEDKKFHWIKIDFNKWKDEDDSDDEAGPMGGGGGGGMGMPGAGGDFEEMMRQMGGLGGVDGLDEMDDNEKDSDDEPIPDLED